MELGDLPPEVLAFIFELETEHRTSDAPFNAWLTGNRKLRSKLTNGGVTVVNYTNLKRGSLLRVPEFVKQWKLTHFSIYGPSCTLLPLDARDVDSLSSIRRWSNLTSLNLDIRGGDSCFFPMLSSPIRFGASSTGSPSPPLAKRPKHSELTSIQHNLRSTDDFDAENLFSKLQSLRLMVDAMMDTTHLLAAIPRSLTSLGLNWDEFKRPPPSYAGLPQTLLEIALPPESVNESNLSTLPRSLTSINYEGFTEEAYKVLMKQWETLLPNLDAFPFDGIMDDVLWYELLEADASGGLSFFKFPSNVRFLTFCHLIANYSIPLPTGLRRLTMVDQEPFTQTLLATWLPPSLMELEASILWKRIEPHHWPRSLTVLWISDATLSVKEARQLPRTLKQLVIGNWTSKPTSKKLRPMLLENDTDRQLWSVSKQALIDNRMKKDSAYEALTERYIREAESGGFCDFPISLEELEIEKADGILPLLLPKLRFFQVGKLDDDFSPSTCESWFGLVSPSVDLGGSLAHVHEDWMKSKHV